MHMSAQTTAAARRNLVLQWALAALVTAVAVCLVAPVQAAQAAAPVAQGQGR